MLLNNFFLFKTLLQHTFKINILQKRLTETFTQAALNKHLASLALASNSLPNAILTQKVLDLGVGDWD